MPLLSTDLTMWLVLFNHLTINSTPWHASSTLSFIVLVDVGMTALHFGQSCIEAKNCILNYGRRCECENEVTPN